MKHIIFETASTKLYFNSRNGRLEQIEYDGTLIPLSSKLWLVETANGKLTIDDMTQFNCERYENRLKLIWHSEAASVYVAVKEGDSGKINMNISIDTHGAAALNEVVFPIIEGLRFDTDNHLLITWQNGRIIKNPVDNFLCKGHDVPFWVGRGKYGYQNEYPAALSFQYAAFCGEDFGYYFATEDPDVYIKTFSYDYNKELHAMDFSVINYPENMGATTSYSMKYDFVLKLMHGDWQDATLLYRDWAIKQKWCQIPLREKKLPEKLVKTDLWRINHTNYDFGKETQAFFDNSVKLRDGIDGNLALHWYGWNMGVHDMDYPEYISQAKKDEGWYEELKEWNKKFDDEGIVKIPYHNARLWEKKTKSWTTENVHAAAIKDKNGELLDEPWMPWMGYELKAICPSSAMWQNKVADLCREYGTEAGFDGVYLDQIASMNSTLCFDKAHPHPVGGGTWWNDTYHIMMSKVRDIMGDESIITTESCCETYIDVFDLFLILDTCFQYTAFNAMSGGNTEQVPLFSLIYGDYALSYGSICRFDNPLNQFEYKYIRNILWGILPTVESVDTAELDNGKAHLEVTKRGVDFFKENKDIFLYGRLAKIPEYSCDTIDMKWTARDEAKNTFDYIRTIQSVCVTQWETKDKEKLIFAYNFSDDTKTVKMADKQFEVAAHNFVKI